MGPGCPHLNTNGFCPVKKSSIPVSVVYIFVCFAVVVYRHNEKTVRAGGAGSGEHVPIAAHEITIHFLAPDCVRQLEK